MAFFKKSLKSYLLIILIFATITLSTMAAISLIASRNLELPEHVVDFTYDRKLKVLNSHIRPNGEDEVEYSIYLDENGMILGAYAQGLEPAIYSKFEEFSEQLSNELTGKKLSDLQEIDKLGTSSITTWSFNEVIDEFKSQL